MISSCSMPSKKKPPNSKPTYRVGDRVRVNMHRGRIVDGTVKAVVDHTDGPRLQVDFGNDETALIYLWQVVKNEQRGFRYTEAPIDAQPELT
jgi:hypothetical protein